MLEGIGREVCARIANGWPGPNISAVVRDAVESFPQPHPQPMDPGDGAGRHVAYRHTWPPGSPLRLGSDGIRGALAAYLAQPVAARARGLGAPDRRRA